MASTFTATLAAAATGTYIGGSAFGEAAVVVSSYALTAALVIDDIIQMVRVMPGGRVYDGNLHVPDLDSNGAPAITLDVGYGGDDDYFIAANTVGQAGGIARFGATAAVVFSTSGPLILSATLEDTVDIHVKAAPATGVATGTLYLTVEMQPPGSY